MIKKNKSLALALLTGLSFVFATVPTTVPSVASTPTAYNANGVTIGTSTSTSLKVDVQTSSGGVTLSYKVGGSVATFGQTTTSGSVSVSRIRAFIDATGPSENIYAAGAQKSADNETLVVGTGMALGVDTYSNPISLQTSSFGFANETGQVVLCLLTNFYYADNNAVELWHCTDPFIWPGTAQSQQNNNQFMPPPQQDEAAPAKYSGPEFSGLAGIGIMTGSTGKLEGKRLNEISSIEIGGKAATFTATSHEELELSLPAGLAPGLYDLVINSSAGKLTHINAIQVRAPKQSFSITTRSTGKISNDQYIEHSLIAAMQIPELNKARCVVNANSIAMARAMAKRLCAVVKASNPNIETTIVEPRSTVKGDAVFARVIYGWN